MSDKLNFQDIPKELLEQAMKCQDVDELMELAKSQGYDFSKEEIEAYLAEFESLDLDDEQLDQIAGGKFCYLVACPKTRPGK